MEVSGVKSEVGTYADSEDRAIEMAARGIFDVADSDRYPARSPISVSPPDRMFADGSRKGHYNMRASSAVSSIDIIKRAGDMGWNIDKIDRNGDIVMSNPGIQQRGCSTIVIPNRPVLSMAKKVSEMVACIARCTESDMRSTSMLLLGCPEGESPKVWALTVISGCSPVATDTPAFIMHLAHSVAMTAALGMASDGYAPSVPTVTSMPGRPVDIDRVLSGISSTIASMFLWDNEEPSRMPELAVAQSVIGAVCVDASAAMSAMSTREVNINCYSGKHGWVSEEGNARFRFDMKGYGVRDVVALLGRRFNFLWSTATSPKTLTINAGGKSLPALIGANYGTPMAFGSDEADGGEGGDAPGATSIDLPCHGIRISISGGHGNVRSDLHGEEYNQSPGWRHCDESMIAAIELMVLSCAMSGVNVESPQFIEAIEAAVDSISKYM